jgi:predicted house-cleaning NTP pyrophosphatase (Maf/HAM1 superfamily)
MCAPETTSVHLRQSAKGNTGAYVRSGEPMDKAGYAIKWASRFVTNVEGDYNNVVGLPVELVLRMLQTRVLEA